MATARIDGNWFRCSKCGHKIGRKVGVWPEFQALPALEIKCKSCKTINYIMIGGKNNDKKNN